jgi:hypothetical protein
MIANIVAGALIGAVGGALGGLLGAAFDNLRGRGNPASPRKHNSGAIVGVVIGMAVLNATGLRDQVARVIDPPSPIEAFGQEMVSIPGVKARIRGKSPQEIQAITQGLSAAGMLKLDDAGLVKRAQLVSKMLTNIDDATCAKFAAGSFTGDDFVRMMGALPMDEQTAWFKLIRAAVEAEIGGAPEVLSHSPEQIASALSSIGSGLPEEEQSRFNNNLAALSSAPPAEACWTIRTLYSLVSGSSGGTQATVARALITP